MGVKHLASLAQISRIAQEVTTFLVKRGITKIVELSFQIVSLRNKRTDSRDNRYETCMTLPWAFQKYKKGIPLMKLSSQLQVTLHI